MSDNVVAIFDHANQEEQELEVLYGWSGYLYCLLTLLRLLPEDKTLEQLAIKVVGIVVEEGLKMGKGSFLVAWPRERGTKFYIGGAHGLAGALQMLL
jgi:hypothetical protein